MSAFDAMTKIKRMTSDPLTDHTLPNSRSLAWAHITTPAAVAGTLGFHCDLVHGNYWHDIRGDHDLRVTADQTIKVMGKHKETLVESCYQNIVGPHIVQNHNPRNETRMAKFHLVYGEHEQSSDNLNDFSVVANTGQFVFLFNLECDAVAKMEFAGVHVETKILHLTADMYDIQAVYAAAIQAAAQLSIQLAGTNIQYNHFSVKTRAAIELKVAPSTFWLGAAKLFAGPIAGPNQIL
jgi:hypothetical protein